MIINMKKLIPFINSLAFMLTFLGLNSQEINKECITQVPKNIDQIEEESRDTYNSYINQYYEKLNNKSSTAITQIPAKLHIVTNSSGYTSVTVDEILDELQEANIDLADSFLEVYICDEINYIANDQLYEFDISNQNLLYQNHQSNIMNIYFVEEIDFGDGAACGYTYFGGALNGNGDPEQYYDTVVMRNNCIGYDRNTLVHEFGHHFNLYHTHGDGTPAEYVNGVNCNSAGDFLCDTPADPQLSSSTVSNINCLYSGNETDPLGTVYDPDTSNYMSYAPQSCRDNFSPMGNARMFAAFHTFRSYYECPSFNVDILSDQIADCDNYMSVNFTDASVGATAWEWDVDGDDIIDYYEQNPNHIYSPGTYDVTLKISNGEETLTKVFPQYVNFTSNIYDTSKVNLKLMIIDLNENTWEFTDSNNNIIYEGGPYDQNGEYTHELEINQSECYTFTIYDTAGNGLDSSNWMVGNEYYELTTESGDLIHTNTNFGEEESVLISTQNLNIVDISLNSLFIYPNPAENYIQIKYQNTVPNSFKIFDINGRRIHHKEINSEADLIFNTTNLVKGMYFISIQISEKNKRLKFIVK